MTSFCQSHLRIKKRVHPLEIKNHTRQSDNVNQTIKDHQCRISGAKLSSKLTREIANRNCQKYRSVRTEHLSTSVFFLVCQRFALLYFFFSLFSVFSLSPYLPLSFLLSSSFSISPLYHVFFCSPSPLVRSIL